MVEGGDKLKWWKAERSQEGGSAEAVFLSFDGQCSAVGGLTWNAVLNISQESDIGSNVPHFFVSPAFYCWVFFVEHVLCCARAGEQ